jgi:hypothetical protein
MSGNLSVVWTPHGVYAVDRRPNMNEECPMGVVSASSLAGYVRTGYGIRMADADTESLSYPYQYTARSAADMATCSMCQYGDFY